MGGRRQKYIKINSNPVKFRGQNAAREESLTHYKGVGRKISREEGGNGKQNTEI